MVLFIEDSIFILLFYPLGFQIHLAINHLEKKLEDLITPISILLSKKHFPLLLIRALCSLLSRIRRSYTGAHLVRLVYVEQLVK